MLQGLPAAPIAGEGQCVRRYDSPVMALSRTPPAAVKEALRREVGWGCPANRRGQPCGSPFLTFHHFDPPWRVEQHHRPERMIALCREHADKADAGTYTDDQLRALKASVGQANLIRGQFDWMRQKLLAVIGGNFYYEVPNAVVVQGHPVVSFGRDADGHWLLNLVMPSAQPSPRLVVVENELRQVGVPTNLECPPNGRLLRAEYDNGDEVRIEFIPDMTEAQLIERYPALRPLFTQRHEELDDAVLLPTPLTAVEVTMQADRLPIDFGPRETHVGRSTVRGCLLAHSPNGFVASY